MKVRLFGKLEYSAFADCTDKSALINLRAHLDTVGKLVAKSAVDADGIAAVLDPDALPPKRIVGNLTNLSPPPRRRRVPKRSS